MPQPTNLAVRAHRLHLQIAIDGPAGSGKSTLGLGLAGALECEWLDSGLLYRAVTDRALKSGIATSDALELAIAARRLKFEVSGGQLLIDGVPAGRNLRASEVDGAVSAVSAHPEVREVLTGCQRTFAQGRCVVIVGRDIGTVVLPDAHVKLWVTASPSERARRRQLEQGADPSSSRSRALEKIDARDSIDSNRSVSPLRRSPDAAMLITDNLSPRQALAQALTIVREGIDEMYG